MQFVTKYIEDENYLIFEKPSFECMQKINGILAKCQNKTNGYVSIKIDRPYKQRTTGEGSQNNKFYALVTEIARDTGNDIEDVKNGIKERAIKRGYPYRLNPISQTVKPYSTTEINTLEMSYLIEECLQVCAELGIVTQ